MPQCLSSEKLNLEMAKPGFNPKPFRTFGVVVGNAEEDASQEGSNLRRTAKRLYMDLALLNTAALLDQFLELVEYFVSVE
jgi:hypothetical protein